MSIETTTVAKVGRLFYCGGAKGLERKDFRYSVFGIFLANSLFPEFEGTIRVSNLDESTLNMATPLTSESIERATEKDLLIYHAHQHCDVPIYSFPGDQLHINAEFYDIHPINKNSNNGKLTLNYLPPGDRSYVIGPHEDSEKSIRVPYCLMKLWFLHKSRPDEVILPKILDHNQKPKNTKEFFVLYANSHYIDYREQAAYNLSKIGTVHTLGKCQGNIYVVPDQIRNGRPLQCIPFEDERRPSQIQPAPVSASREEQGRNSAVFARYKFVLVMENANVPGYISEKILDGFLSGAIPIYYGTPDVLDIFNSKAFIYYDVQYPNEALERIKRLVNNPSEYDQMLNEPILADGVNTIDKFFSWDETVGTGALKARIRKMMGYGV